MSGNSSCCRMMQYMAWANKVTLDNVAQLPDAEIHAPRDTLFKSIAGTFDHILVVEEMFMAHLQGKPHPHTSRSRAVELPFAEIRQRLVDIDQRFIDLAAESSAADLAEIIEFDFVDGGYGAMTREDILLHLANHSTYHRGFISVLLYPFGVKGAASDYTVFLRDVWEK